MPQIQFNTCVLLLLTMQSFSQTILWEKNYGGSKPDATYRVINTSNNNIVGIGGVFSNDFDVTNYHNQGDWWVYKTDENGNLLWATTIGGSKTEQCNDVIETQDGGYLLVGYSHSTDGDFAGWTTFIYSDLFVVKLDINGNILWKQNYGGSQGEKAWSVVENNDGSFTIAGTTDSMDGDVSFNNGYTDCWLIKIDPNGAILWEKSFGGSLFDEGRSISKTQDNGYVIAGFSQSNDGDLSSNYGMQDSWILKTDNLGNLLWSVSLGGSNIDWFEHVICNTNNEYIATGRTSSNDFDVSNPLGDNDYWLVKMDANGNVIWERTFGGSGSDIANQSIISNSNTYVVSGTSGSLDGDKTIGYGSGDYWIINIGDNGDLIWEYTFGGSAFENPKSIIQTPDLNYVAAGGSSSTDGDVSNNYGSEDCWMVKFSKACDPINVNWYHTYDSSAFSQQFCPNDSAAISLIIEGGTPPYNISITYDSDTLTYTNLQAMDTIIIHPTISGLLKLISIEDAQTCGEEFSSMYLSVVVTKTNPSWQPLTPICENESAIPLDILRTGDYGGTWSGIGVNNNLFYPSDLGGQSIDLTYTIGDTLCYFSETHTITVLPLTDEACHFSEDCDLITNGDFEQYSICPNSSDQVTASTWNKAAVGEGWCLNSTDYINLSCGPSSYNLTPPTPLPSGNGTIGIIINNSSNLCNGGFYKEYLGQFASFKANQSYSLTISLALSTDSTSSGSPYNQADNNVCLYVGNTATFPVSVDTFNCPIDFQIVDCISKNDLSTSWSNYSLDFELTENYNALIIGGDCNENVTNKNAYLFVDDLSIVPISTFELSTEEDTVKKGDGVTISTITNSMYLPVSTVLIQDPGQPYIINNLLDSFNITASYTGLYSFTSMDSIGCQFENDVYLEVIDCNTIFLEEAPCFDFFESVFIPNTFTPNNDLKNNIFIPIFSNADALTSYHLSIYDRWGNVLFETTEHTEGWDGHETSDGVYSYRLEYIFKNGKQGTHFGKLLLLR